MDISFALTVALNKDKDASLAFWVKDIMYITKLNGEFYETQRGIKDPEYSGHRYVWASDRDIKLFIIE